MSKKLASSCIAVVITNASPRAWGRYHQAQQKGPVPKDRALLTLVWLVDLLHRYSNQTYTLKRVVKTMEAARLMTSRDTKIILTPLPYKLSRRLTEEQIEQLVAGYTAGSSTPKLALQHGISKTAIKKLLHERGVVLPYRVLDGEQAQLACELYASGLSLAKVGDKLGCSRKAVTTALENSGIQRRDAHGRPRA